MSKGLLITVEVLLLAVAVAGVADWTFWRRYLAIREQTPITYPHWVSPTETVAGDFRSALPAAGEDQRTLSQATIDAAVAYAEKTGSFSLLIWHDGRIQHEQYWQGLGPDDVTETYSMAKSMLGIMTGFAVADGALSLDDPVVKFIPEWRGTPAESMTIRNVMNMSSGLEYFRFDYRPWQNPYKKALRLFIGPDMERAILRFDVDSPPGEAFRYNSANTQLMLLILSRATGKRYADVVSERLWQPLGAKDARLWLDRPGGLPKAYSFFMARPRDWLRVGIMLTQNGQFEDRQVVDPGWIAAMRTPAPTNPKYGLQLWLGSPYVADRRYNPQTPVGVKQAEPFPVDDVFFFDGGGGQRVYAIPSQNLAIVRTGLPSPDFDDGVLPNIVLNDLLAQEQ